MNSRAEGLTKEPHVFRLTQMLKPRGGAVIAIVSWDATIVYLLEDDDYWNNQFPSGENRIYVRGHWDLLDQNIYLGDRIEGLTW